MTSPLDLTQFDGHTPGPWEYVPSTDNHGAYVSNRWGAGDICDCYTMSNPRALAVCNGGVSKPIPHQGDESDANAALIAAAPDLLEEVKRLREALEPFARAADVADERALTAEHTGWGVLTEKAKFGLGLTFGDVRRARRALNKESG